MSEGLSSGTDLPVRFVREANFRKLNREVGGSTGAGEGGLEERWIAAKDSFVTLGRPREAAENEGVGDGFGCGEAGWGGDCVAA